MAGSAKKQQTTVGRIDQDVLAFTAGKDVQLDQALVEVDCLGSAAHARMLSEINIKPRILKKTEWTAIRAELIFIIKQSRKGRFEITQNDQDVHLAVERVLTDKLGELGKKIHTGRSRNDQVAVDLRLFTRQALTRIVEHGAQTVAEWLQFAKQHAAVPMVGRTHQQPAMPGTVGLWAAAHAESLLDDLVLVMNAFELNDVCPLGAAAGYGVPIPLDRQKVSDLLGFTRPSQTVLYGITARGKIESIVLSAMSQVMLTLSRMAEDVILYGMPEFGYFQLPEGFCTGSSIMPQKKNPDVLELIRAKAARVQADAQSSWTIIKALPSGYNRDIQETKEPLMNGLETAEKSLLMVSKMMKGMKVNEEALVAGFRPEVFATDEAIRLVSEGMPFRDAYHQVKASLKDVQSLDPYKAIACKTSYGATAGIDFEAMENRAANAAAWANEGEKEFNACISRLLGTKWPALRK